MGSRLGFGLLLEASGPYALGFQMFKMFGVFRLRVFSGLTGVLQRFCVRALCGHYVGVGMVCLRYSSDVYKGRRISQGCD